MKNVLLLLIVFLSSFTPEGNWHTDIAQAKQIAQTEHKYILLNFSGSDWCGPCIRMRKEIFESASFLNFAKTNLVLLNADFPRLKKNKLSQEQQDKNDQLAERYNQKGIFPCTVLLNENGDAIKIWEGFQKVGAESFLETIQYTIANNGK